jgi:hypothetical protein
VSNREKDVEKLTIEKGKVVWSNVEIGVGKTNKHSVVNDVVVDVVEYTAGGLHSLTHTISSDLQWGISNIELTDPSDESGSSGLVGDGSNVGVVCRYVHTRLLPREHDSPTCLGQRWLWSVDCRLRVFGSKRKIVGNVQIRE